MYTCMDVYISMSVFQIVEFQIDIVLLPYIERVLSLNSNIYVPKVLTEHFILAALLCHFQIMLLTLKGIVLPSKNSLPKWRDLSELIRFGLVARKKNWKVLVR